MTLDELSEIFVKSNAVFSYYSDLVSTRLGDGRHHDLLYDGARKSVRRRTWELREPSLGSSEVLLARNGPGKAPPNAGGYMEFVDSLVASYLLRRERRHGPELGIGR